MAAPSDRCPQNVLQEDVSGRRDATACQTAGQRCRSSLVPCRRPAVENGWHGYPADKMSTGSTTSQSMVVMSPWFGTSGQWWAHTDAGAGSSSAPMPRCARGLRGRGRHRRCPGRAIRLSSHDPKVGRSDGSDASHPHPSMMQSRVTDAVVVPTVRRVLVGGVLRAHGVVRRFDPVIAHTASSCWLTAASSSSDAMSQPQPALVGLVSRRAGCRGASRTHRGPGGRYAVGRLPRKCDRLGIPRPSSSPTRPTSATRLPRSPRWR